MSDPDQDQREPESKTEERAGDSLRTAVERTLAATAGSALETRQRARSLLDEVSRRGEEARDELVRRGEEARDELGRRGEAAREQVVRSRDAARGDLARRGEEATGRLAEAIADLNLSDREDLGPVVDRIAAVEARLGDLERLLRRERLEQADTEGNPNPEVEDESSHGGTDAGA